MFPRPQPAYVRKDHQRRLGPIHVHGSNQNNRGAGFGPRQRHLVFQRCGRDIVPFLTQAFLPPLI